VPPPPRGQRDAEGAPANAQLRWRADEAAIGYRPQLSQALPSTLPATLVAFYLPQFHTFPENDAWWGKGFTEWTNATKARPLFDGHYQPHLPSNGFYDLRDRHVQHQQIREAKAHGIDAFCFHYYWFGGRRLLERPVDEFLSDKKADIEFCLCWANENWTRAWDASEREILIEQTYSPKNDIDFIESLLPFFRDRRYLRVDGKPLLVVYRPQQIPEPAATVRRCAIPLSGLPHCSPRALAATGSGSSSALMSRPKASQLQ